VTLEEFLADGDVLKGNQPVARLMLCHRVHEDDGISIVDA
jgi:hypothetical protein